MSHSLHIEPFFDADTFSYSYVAVDTHSKQCAIIDSVLNYDHASGRTRTQGADDIIHYVRDNQLSVQWILETHVHADHISAAPYLKQHLGGEIVIGEHISTVQSTFSKLFNAQDVTPDGSAFDRLLADEEQLPLGNLTITAWHTPGHTPACLTYLIEDAAFIGDTLFMPDYGSARCDFPGGNAEELYRSVQRLYRLPDETRLFMCHDYLPAQRQQYHYQTTVGDQKTYNIHLNAHTRLTDFLRLRQARDAQLAMPKLLLPAVQMNMRAGNLPPAEENGTVYLKIPLNVL